MTAPSIESAIETILGAALGFIPGNPAILVPLEKGGIDLAVAGIAALIESQSRPNAAPAGAAAAEIAKNIRASLANPGAGAPGAVEYG